METRCFLFILFFYSFTISKIQFTDLQIKTLEKGLFTIVAMLVFKLSCKLAMCYAGGQTLEKRQIAENWLVVILKEHC